MKRRFGKIIALLMAASILASCKSASETSADLSSSDQMTSETVEPEYTDPGSGTSDGASYSYETIIPEENPLVGTELEKYCSDNFVVLDNSNGFVNVYEIEPQDPLHLTRRWASDHLNVETNMTFFESTNWVYEYDRLWVLWYFMGKPINCYSGKPDQMNEQDMFEDTVTYEAPEGAFSNVVSAMKVSKIGCIPGWMELPFSTSIGRIDPGNQILVFDMERSAFPEEASYAPGYPPYFPEEYDTLHFISLTDKYIDDIPVYGSLYCIAEPWGVYDYEDILHTARGSNLITTMTGTYQINDTVVQMVRTDGFTVKQKLKSDLSVLPLSECVEGIKESAEYFNIAPEYWTIDQMTFYCAELSYLPLTNYDPETYDYTDERTYLIPIWNLYFYVDKGAPGFCITVDATTGKSLYSKEYSLYDQRLEKPDPEMTGGRERRG